MTDAQLITALQARTPRAAGADEPTADLERVKAILEDAWMPENEDSPRHRYARIGNGIYVRTGRKRK